MPPKAKAPATRSASKSASKSKSKSEKGLTKSQLVSALAEKSDLSRAQVSTVFEELCSLLSAELRASRPVTIPNIVKITVQHKPATPSRPGRNPFTGESITIKAKPARKAVKVRPVKALKDLV